MQKNKTLKGLLAVSAVAAMFSAVGVHAQVSLNSNPAQTGTTTTDPNLAGKTTKSGTIGNTNSIGMQSSGAQSSQGMDNTSGSSSNAAGMSASGQTGASGAAGTAAAGNKLSNADEKAVKDMAMADMAEVATGKMAQTKAQSPEVKAFAQQMIDDHGAALAKVQALAQARGVNLPNDVDAKHKRMAAKLEKMNGAEFDKAYMTMAGVKDHSTVLKKLQADAKKITDPEVKALAQQHIPVVEQHLKAAEQMHMTQARTTAGQ